MLPRTEFWQKTHGNFYKTMWPNYTNTWMNLQEQVDYIEEKCKDMKEKEIKAVLKKPMEVPQEEIGEVVEVITPPKKTYVYKLGGQAVV